MADTEKVYDNLIIINLYGMLLKLSNEPTNGQEYLDIALFVSLSPNFKA